MPLLTAPIMAKFVEDYGCKRMTVIGGAISAFGFIVSSLCNSVDQLYLTIGLIGGSGLSAAYIVGLVSVERWFEARRSLAIGIVSAGTGFGTFIFPPIAQYCLDALKWRLTIVVLSGLLMLMPLIGVFLDDPPWKNIENIAKQEKKFDKIPLNINTTLEKDHKMIRKLKTLVDFSHFRNKNFSLLGISSFAIYTLYNTAFYFLPELLRDSDLESAYFISITGFFLMIGMISLGWISDFKKTNVFMLNAACVLSKNLCYLVSFLI